MRKIADIGCILLIVTLSLLSSCSNTPTLTYKGTVAGTILYTSTVTFDETHVSHAMGVFLDDGTYFRFVGAQQLTSGANYTIIVEPNYYGQTWDRLISIKKLN